MKTNFRVGILGAGLGSRLKNSAPAKPLALLCGKTMLEQLVDRFQRAGCQEILCALRGELIDSQMREQLPRVGGVSYLFTDTESSLHTLAELIRGLGITKGGVLFSMADTIMLPSDFERFMAFCKELKSDECAVLLTPYVDDENPLWSAVNSSGYVTSFGSEPTAFVTSGMYFLQPSAMQFALELVGSGTQKMRNFLTRLVVERQMPVKSFVVNKTIDVDHPSDLEKAAAFLRGD